MTDEDNVCGVERLPEFDEDRRSLFAASAKTYEDGRPGYPRELFERLTERCGLRPGSRVLEIGPGTGQATGPLLDAGATVTAVEVGVEFGRLLESKFAQRSLDVIVGDFETVGLPSEPFDLVAAATSFHWIPPGRGLARVGELLRPGCSLALWWNYYGDPEGPDAFHKALRPILRRHAPHLDDDAGVGAHPYARDVAARTAEIQAADLFGPVDHEFFAWTATHTPTQLRQLFASLSHWMALEDEVKATLLDEVEQLANDEFGGVIQRRYLTALYTAKRLA